MFAEVLPEDKVDKITELNITLSAEAMETLRDSYKEDVEASIEFDGITPTSRLA